MDNTAPAADLHAGVFLGEIGMAGRPTKYTETLGDEIIQWMTGGYSLTAAAGKIGVSRQTVYRWADENPAFRDTLNTARAAAAAWWEDQARKTATTGEGNASVVIFALKNRVADEWRDKQEVDHTSSDKSMSPAAVSAEVVEGLVKKLVD